MELTARLARAQQIAVLFTEHDMDVVFSQADRIIVLDRGRADRRRPARRGARQSRRQACREAVYLGQRALMI